MDSAAEESVCPKEWAAEFGLRPAEDSKKMRFVNASGGDIQHYGSRAVAFKSEAEGQVMGLKFQVTDVRKPLVAVARVVEVGNIVQFGPRAEDNYVYNRKTGSKVMMEKKGNSFVIKGELESGFPFRGQAHM